jgi:hypothetical protein
VLVVCVPFSWGEMGRTEICPQNKRELAAGFRRERLKVESRGPRAPKAATTFC